MAFQPSGRLANRQDSLYPGGPWGFVTPSCSVSSSWADGDEFQITVVAHQIPIGEGPTPHQRFIVAGRAMAAGALDARANARGPGVAPFPPSLQRITGMLRPRGHRPVHKALRNRSHGVKTPISLRSVATEQFSHVTMLALLSERQSCSAINHPRIHVGLCFEQGLRDLKMAL